ncbi:3'(2'),5'-bisphosphate nucleotidase CysQ family protein [Bradyrhizobium quebecense]|uniref:3'(2'),5'-bisphosphate nucleotidase CysQ family protein n=1 Tax=Bradyrhizobium quebecense TaxID=2748629 RepID=UPI003B848B06
MRAIRARFRPSATTARSSLDSTHARAAVALRGPLTELLIRARGDIVRSRLGSALKFAWVADGRIDAYPRLAPTREWDVAAGHAIVTAAGGAVTDSRGEPLEFGQIPTGFAIPEFIAWGDPGAICQLRRSWRLCWERSPVEPARTAGALVIASMDARQPANLRGAIACQRSIGQPGP